MSNGEAKTIVTQQFNKLIDPAMEVGEVRNMLKGLLEGALARLETERMPPPAESAPLPRKQTRGSSKKAAEEEAGEEEEEEKAAAEKAAAQKAAAEKAAAQKAAAEKAAAQKAAAQKAAAEKAAAQKAAAKKARRNATTQAASHSAGVSADSAPVHPAPSGAGGQPEAGPGPPSGGAEEEGASEVRKAVASGKGGKFLPLNVKGDTAKQMLCADSLAPTHTLTPDSRGMVPYRHDTLLLRALHPLGNCLLETMMTATGMGVGDLGVNRKALDKHMAEWHVDPRHGPSMGVLDEVLQNAKSPFRLPTVKGLNADLKWTHLLGLTEGIYIALVLACDDGKHIGHFVVFDAWRDMLIMGPKWGARRVQPKDKKDEVSARAYLLEHYQLVTPLRVCRLVVSANRVSETKFNTPVHFAELEVKRVLNDMICELVQRDKRKAADSGDNGVKRQKW
jgi:hypothetical protein